ncbi:MAG: hypothetical protein DBY41_04650 [Clostridium sp.]|nr:MAG: hypothetical protein DBY41_04650 [Clostridium sp.]
MNSSLQTKLLLAIFLTVLLICVIKKVYGEDKIISGTLCIIVIIGIMGAALYSGVYTYATEEKTIPAVDFISISTNKNNFIIKYKNQKGNQKKLKLSDNCKITYKTSNISKIEYKEKTEYNIFKKEINKEIAKITIYKEA